MSVSPPPSAEPPVSYLDAPSGARLAYVAHPGLGPTIVFLGGYASDMTGTKARYLEDWCRARDRAFVRFDYQGHGRSSGRLLDGTIGAWRDDALAVLDGAHAGTAAPRRVEHGRLGHAARRARDAGAHPRAGRRRRGARLHRGPALGSARRGAARDAPAGRRHSTFRPPTASRMPFSWALVEDGRQHLLLRSPLDVPGPVRLLHGTQDADVPWDTSMRLAEAIRGRDVAVTLVKDGGHRLSEPHELSLLGATIASLL